MAVYKSMEQRVGILKGIKLDNENFIKLGLCKWLVKPIQFYIWYSSSQKKISYNMVGMRTFNQESRHKENCFKNPYIIASRFHYFPDNKKPEPCSLSIRSKDDLELWIRWQFLLSNMLNSTAVSNGNWFQRKNMLCEIWIDSRSKICVLNNFENKIWTCIDISYDLWV